MSKPEFLDRLGQILEVPEGSLTGDEKLSDLPEWNSVAMLGFIAFCDETFQKNLSPRNFMTCETVNDLGNLVNVAG